MRKLALFAAVATLTCGPALAGAPTTIYDHTNTRELAIDSSGEISCSNCSGGGGGAQGAPLGVTSTDISGTVTTGGTFQSVSAASASRKGGMIQNPTTATEPLYVFFGANASATTGNSISLAPGGSVSFNAGPIVLQDNVSVTAPTTGHAFNGKVQ